MKQHVLIGRFGPLDRPKTSTTKNQVITRLDLVAAQKRLDYGIGRALDDLKALGVFPSETGLDLLVFAAHVHAADTRISRATESQDTWTREIQLIVPVSNPPLWESARDLLTKLLNFLTGDRWIFVFRLRPKGFTAAVPAPPRRPTKSPFDGLNLFSGGLDSLIGAIDTLENGGTPLLVSHASEGATSDSQRSCFEMLKSHYKGRTFDRLRLWMSFPTTLIRGVSKEDTTRGRSFLFFALGAFAGTGFNGPFTLRVPENGLIALNVPLDPLRLGSLSTRTTHPFYMARWNDLLTVLGIPGRVENPYWNKTKGEMIAACANQPLLVSLIASSLSCSSATKGRWQGRGIEHCGYCIPCVIRRAAIAHALGRGNDPTSYTLKNLSARTLDTRQAEGQQLRSFQLAIERLRSNPKLAKFLIHKPGPLSQNPKYLADLAALYRRGMDEVAAMLSSVKAKPS